MPSVILVCKDGVEVSKPIIRLRIIENLREITANQAIKFFRGVGRLFQKKAPHSYSNYLTDKSKFEKIYKKVFSSLDNFLNLCYTNMNYYVKMRRNWL